jgi:transcriptional regulator with XRE-family HTH domain
VTGRRGSPTLRRRQLGQELRKLRESSGATIDQVAERLACSSSKISRIETGQSGVSQREVRDILTAYGVDGDQAEELVEIAREAKQRGWWQLFGQVLTSAYVGLEAAADAVWSYEVLVVPGLLQTEDYARAMIQAARPDMTDEEVDQRVRVRLNRQSLLTQEDPLQLALVLDEAVLQRPVGGARVMREQLERLSAAFELPNVSLQVLPFAAGAHGGMDGTFTMLRYEDPSNHDLVFSANAAGGLFLEKDEELERYADIFTRLQASALAPRESQEMIAQLAKEPKWK